MFLGRTVLFLYFLSASAWKVQGQRLFIWQSITQRYNSAHVRYLNTSIAQPQNLSFNVEAMYTHPICEDLLHLEVKVLQPQKRSYFQLMNFKFKAIEFIENTFQNNFLAICHESVKNFTNLPHKCPIAPNFHLYFRNFTLFAEKIPMIVPKVNFLAYFKMSRPNNEIIVDVIIKGLVECKERRGFECGFKRG